MSDERRSIEVAGQAHGAQPIPAACVKGGVLASGAVYGLAPGADEADLAGQCAAMFGNLRALLAAAGGDMGDIIKMSVRLADPADRAALNDEWTRAFPDPASRPARHVEAEPMRDARRKIACEILAVISPR